MGRIPGLADARVYTQGAPGWTDDARARAGLLGRHVHLLRTRRRTCGQVEGWLDHPGDRARLRLRARSVRSSSPERARKRRGARPSRRVGGCGAGLGGRSSLYSRRGGARAQPRPGFLCAGRYAPVSWSARIEAPEGAVAPSSPSDWPRDASGRARLRARGGARARRLAVGDAGSNVRPRRGVVATLAAHLGATVAFRANRRRSWPSTGAVIAAASVAVQSLRAAVPPMRRGLVGRFALDVGRPVPPARSRWSRSRVAWDDRTERPRSRSRISRPRARNLRAALATGVRAWSRVVTKVAEPRHLLAPRQASDYPSSPMRFAFRSSPSLAVACGTLWPPPDGANAAPRPAGAATAAPTVPDAGPGPGFDRRGEAPFRGIRCGCRPYESERGPDRRDGSRRKGRRAVAILRALERR